MIIDHDSSTKVARYQALGLLNDFRAGLYSCLTRRADVLFELTDAMLCAPGRVSDLAHLCLEPVHRRGHGALYDALNAGRIDTAELGQLVAATPLPRLPDQMDETGSCSRSMCRTGCDPTPHYQPRAIVLPYLSTRPWARANDPGLEIPMDRRT
ncbi:MAG: transposase [Tessaracoccus sp.]